MGAAFGADFLMKLRGLYNIPSQDDFGMTLARGLLEADLDLADALILLPNRRACRSLQTTFLRLREGEALLLPRLVPPAARRRAALLLALLVVVDGGLGLEVEDDGVEGVAAQRLLRAERVARLAHRLVSNDRCKGL